VAYKPARETFAIVFEERQIQEIEVGLAINMTQLVKNAGSSVSNANFFNTSKNRCQVTLQDPYLDGVAWGALGEIDKVLLNSARQATKSGDILPMCQEGQNPEEDKCLRYAVLDTETFRNSSDGSSVTGDRPWIIITLWYNINGAYNQTIEQTYFYRATQVNITHGVSGEPTVSLRGQSAVNVSFQQNLQPTFFEKNKTLIDELNEKTDIKKEGFSIEDVCSTPADQEKFDRNYRVNNLTTQELLEKWVGSSEGGEILSLPTKEFANKIQICTRQDNKCTFQRVFYLGKGLYEKYSINSKFELTPFEKNLVGGSISEESDVDGVATTDTNKEYDSYRGDPATTSQKLQAVSSEAWQSDETQFTELKDYNTGQSTNGYKGTGTPSTGQPPNIKAGTFKIEKIENQMLFKVASNANCYLGGKVKDEGDGRVLVESEYHIHYCEKGGSKCGTSMVMQEFKNLESIGYGDSKQLAPGASVGQVSSDTDKPSKTRFMIKIGKDSNVKEITLDPTTLQGLISCTLPPTDQDKKEEAPTNESEGAIGDKIGEIGNTGSSSGAHIHAMWWTAGRSAKKPITEADVRRYVEIKGSVSMTSAYGDTRGRPGPHDGVDLAGDQGIELFVKGGAKILDADRGVLNPKGYGYSVVIDTPEGGMLLGHLRAGSIPSGIPGTSGASGSVRRAGNTGEPETSGKAEGITEDGISLTTEFRGVPKALSILPGRTILAFVTNYDEWIRSNKSNAIEPNVWVPEKYRNWVIIQTTHKWTNGDLRVKVEGRRPFRRDRTLDLDDTPKFGDYMADKGYKDYYDYIRSSGDLCYKIGGSGEDSCARCDRGLIGGTDGSKTQGQSPSNVSTNYPRGKFTYTCSRQDSNKFQALLDAGSALGVTNKVGLAGIVSGALQESGLDPTIISGVKGESSQGIFQWNPAPNVLRLQDLKKWASDQGLNYLDFSTQVNYFVYDVKRGYPGLVPALNNASSPYEAANEFDKNYTISGDRNTGPNSTNNLKRTQFVNDVLKCMTDS
jgi:hypothetical protein